jgi:lipid II:glycine glycyltransferase (peptidoglycan interpeptide bridge formation enzyme)
MNNYPIFFEDWWLEAVSEGNAWGKAQIIEQGKVVAIMPWQIKKLFGLRLILQPKLTQTLGPWFNIETDNIKYVRLLSKKIDLTSSLIKQLPKFHYLSMSFTPEFDNWLPFYWLGFTQTTRYTYRFDQINNVNSIIEGMKSNRRGDIQKAKKNKLQIVDTENIEIFIEVNNLTFKRNKIKKNYSDNFIRNLDIICQKKSARKIFLAVDESQKIHAATYLVFNRYCTYNLMSGFNPSFNYGAMTYLMLEAIKFSSTVSERFDFEGSMLPGVENFYRDFGATQYPYFQIKKYNNKFIKILFNFLSLIKR